MENKNNMIKQRNYNDTIVPRVFDLGDYGSTTLNVYQYNHNYKDLYRANTNQAPFVLNNYLAPNDESAMWKGIPMNLRWNAVVWAIMVTGKYRIKYRGNSKPQYNYKRKQNYCLAEYADTFAIYPK